MIALALTLMLSLTTSNTEPLQDPENTCYIDNSCKPTGSVDNPFS